MPLAVLVFNKTHFVSELEALGHTVLVAGVPEEHSAGRNDAWSQTRVDIWYRTGESISEILGRLPKNFKPDCLVYFDDSRPVMRVRGFEREETPSIFYSVDAHVHHGWHSKMSGMFHCVLVAQRDFVPEYAEMNSCAEWFPLWAPEEIHPSSEKHIEVCFRGNLERSARQAFFNELKILVPQLEVKSGPYREAYPFAKIVINEAIQAEVNFRIFETLMCGALLITPRIQNGLFELFQEGLHLLTYEAGNAKDAAQKIKYYLAHPEEAARIAEAGRRLVCQRHSSTARAQDFEAVLMQMKGRDRPAKFFSAAYQLAFQQFVMQNPEKRNLFQEMNAMKELLIKSARQSEKMNEATPFLVEAVVSSFREMDMLHLAEDLLQVMQTQYPEQGVFSALTLDLLQRLGRDQEAQQYAERISPDPQQLLKQAPLFVRQLHESSFLWYGRALNA